MTPTILDHVLSDFKPAVKKTTTEVNGTCDSCGTRASYEALKGSLRLNFCGHHARKNAASLIERDFVISPEDYQLIS